MQINKTAAQIVCGWKCSTFSKIPNEIQTAAHKTWNKTKVGQSLDPVVVSPIYSTSLLNYIVRTWFVAPLHFRIFSMCSAPFVIIISLTVLRCIFFLSKSRNLAKPYSVCFLITNAVVAAVAAVVAIMIIIIACFCFYVSPYFYLVQWCRVEAVWQRESK